MRNWLALAFALALTGVVLLFGPSAAAQTGLPAEALDKDWPLTTLQAAAGESVDTTGKKISVNFAADGSMSGFDGCNRYLGSYTATAEGALEITLGPSTLIACDEDVEALAQDFKAALDAVTGYALTDTGLELTGPRGVTLTFDATATPATGGASTGGTGGTSTGGANTGGAGAGSPPGDLPLPTTGGAEDIAGMLMLAASALIVLGVGMRRLGVVEAE
jgi:heat shock protein HslJ